MEKERQPTVDLNPSRAVSTPKKHLIPLRITHVISFLILFSLWIVFSGRFDAFHLLLGVISSALVSAVSGELMFTTPNPKGIILSWLRLISYIPWLIYQVFLANLHVMYLVFHPKMMDLINPQIIEFESNLKGDYARTTFANSITLTPGTITVNVTALGLYAVHCIDEHSGQALPGEMEAKIAKVFRE